MRTPSWKSSNKFLMQYFHIWFMSYYSASMLIYSSIHCTKIEKCSLFQSNSCNFCNILSPKLQLKFNYKYYVVWLNGILFIRHTFKSKYMYLNPSIFWVQLIVINDMSWIRDYVTSQLLKHKPLFIKLLFNEWCSTLRRSINVSKETCV